MAFLAPVVGWLASSAGAATLAAGSIALTAYGMSESAKVNRKAASAEDYAAQVEAAQLEERAKATLAAGSYNSDRIKTKAQQILSSQRAAAAAGNNDTNDQSAAEITKRTIQESSLDQLLAMAEAQDDAKKDVYQAGIARKTGKMQADVLRNRARADLIGGAGTILGMGFDWAQSYGGRPKTAGATG